MSGSSEQHFEPAASLETPALQPRLGSRPPLKRTSLGVLGTRRDVYRAKLVFYLFLVSLGVFFAAGMASYYIIRTQSFQPVTLEYLQLRLPLTFWLSTLTLLFISGFLQASVWAVRREYQVVFRRFLIFAWISALVFLGIQYFGLMELIDTHFSRIDGSSKAYGLCFTMAFLHALHVLGGMGFLGFVIWQAFHLRYDHERNYAVEHCAAYWHFLDVVWVSMLLTFVITG